MNHFCPPDGSFLHQIGRLQCDTAMNSRLVIYLASNRTVSGGFRLRPKTIRDRSSEGPRRDARAVDGARASTEQGVGTGREGSTGRDHVIHQEQPAF